MNEVIRVSEKTKEKMIDYYKDKKKDKKIPYVVFQAVDMDTTITMYESGKVMFQGKSADVDAAMWREIDGQSKVDKTKQKEEDKKYYYCSSVGSDEVGTGDYFGPIVVTATYVKKEDIPFLESLGIKDSKKVTDELILKVVPELIKKIPYRSLILTNKEYNEKYSRDFNMNRIKAIMHNKVLYQIMTELKPAVDYIIVDEFAREARYYDYIKEAQEIQKGITFMTKAEDKNLAVASASMISRYIFLKEFDKLCDEVSLPLPKGAGSDVDKMGEELVAKYGEEKLKEVAKYNFKNTQKILKTMIF
ncbi:MAG TPA: ribonuclease HIII [Candidatus Onthousia faecigallinarum]|nr:ribonuclease HIII [Candidatus Onthousia faecigallinarum]